VPGLAERFGRSAGQSSFAACPSGERRRSGLSLASMRVLDSLRGLEVSSRAMGGLGRGLSVGDNLEPCFWVDGLDFESLLYEGVAN